MNQNLFLFFHRAVYTRGKGTKHR